jgi:hypothetical protein
MLKRLSIATTAILFFSSPVFAAFVPVPSEPPSGTRGTGSRMVEPPALVIATSEEPIPLPKCDPNEIGPVPGCIWRLFPRRTIA